MRQAASSARGKQKRPALVLVLEVVVGTAGAVALAKAQGLAVEVVQGREKERVAQAAGLEAALEVEAAARVSEQGEDRGAVPGVVRDSARERELGQARAQVRALDLFPGLALSAVVAQLGLPPGPVQKPPNLRIAPPTVSISFQPLRAAAD